MLRIIAPTAMLLIALIGAARAEEREAATASAAGHEPAPAADAAARSDARSDKPMSVSNGQALQRLMEGNARYAAGKAQHPREDAARRAETASAQKPFAIVLTCADSRVAPELVFDQGLGDIFVIRVAGNVADDDVQASIEYSVEHLNTNLILVMGHQNCGAVKAALGTGELPGHLAGLIERIRPAVEASRALPGDATSNAVCANARLVATQLKASRPLLKSRAAFQRRPRTRRMRLRS